MSAKAINEATGKRLLNEHLAPGAAAPCEFAVVNPDTHWDTLRNSHPWLATQASSTAWLQETVAGLINWNSVLWLDVQKLVVKPDQLIKRRGKLGLIHVNGDLNSVQDWVKQRMDKEVEVGRAKGCLRHFIIEPFCKHSQEEEAYVCIYSHRNGDTILFHHEGGVDIGDVDSKAFRLEVPIDHKPTADEVTKALLTKLPQDKRSLVATFICSLYDVYVDLYFTYLEINPLVVTGGQVHILDLAAKLDATAEFVCKQKWGDVTFPPPFGRDATTEEAYIAELDSKSGASLKLTVLNAKGRIWTMVAGGGASVIYSDTVCDLGGASELANYGEYSGAPTEQQTYEYAKVILGLMTHSDKHPDGKVLIIGGGIANFTNVAATFKGIVKALQEFRERLVEHRVSVFVRRAGPNYQEGLRVMKEVGRTLGVPVHVFGPETHMTAIVAMAMGRREVPDMPEPNVTTANFLLPGGMKTPPPPSSPKKEMRRPVFPDHAGEQSVVAMVYPFTGDHKQKFYWGHKEVLLPVYKNMADAMKRHPDADVLINFASLRSAYESTFETLQYPQIRTIAIIAEGIPENMTRKMIKAAHSKGVNIIGPATVGGIKPGCFKIGNTGGMMDNILASKLYRPGSVAYVSRSGGMSNELNNIISRATNGVYEGVAIGGDRYPGTTFMDHLVRYQADPQVKMLVLLGEVGGIEEYEVCEALQSGRLNKPLVAWCIGTCASMFSSEVQFGHAGACANSSRETASAKNEALAKAGAHVPPTFDALGDTIKIVYDDLVGAGVIVPMPEVPPPTVPMDYNWARELGLIRKPASFMTSICDERGQELLYAGMPITTVIEKELGIGGVLSLLWFQRRLPQYACKFLEMVLMVTADHGPAVSGAHNTIVCARAGKDLISSLVSGLLTIGDRFGGALDAAARQFGEAYNTRQIPMEFVNSMRKKGVLIMGIGHRVKSVSVHCSQHLSFVSTQGCGVGISARHCSRKPNLILNVDGLIGVAVVDLLQSSGCFTPEEAQDYVEMGALNGLFVLGRTIGFIGHYLDQKRLRQGLYRHPWDDISYVLPETEGYNN
ncbi:hypothetical protein HPB49_014500 [Dermacentor silvarum]|uniref:Uncharacterized protein n=1 Tax=Dermacentor silvarum TaxID=543639 RepID=A0ACB8DDM4_DERSI|nr:hypothetical protein HPB49_014500 [Dermacentor silvarum]